mgnify:CR=1 FL=1
MTTAVTTPTERWTIIGCELLDGELSEESSRFLLTQGKIKASTFGIGREDREDVVGMAIMALLQKANNGEYDPSYSPATYFFTMVKGYALNTYRSNKVRMAVPILSDEEDTTEPQAATPSPLELLDSRTEILDIIRAAFKGNATLDCTLDVMLEFDGEDGLAPAVADYLGISLQAAYNNINKVRHITAHCLL